MAYELHIGLHVGAPREKVFEHLLTAHHLARWFCNFAQVEPKPGGRFFFGGDYAIALPEEHGFAAKFTGGEVKRSVTFAWPLYGAHTSVTWAIEDAGDGSILRTTHTGLPTLDGTCGSLHDAWRLCLGNLKAVCEGRSDSLRPDHYPFQEPAIELVLLIDAPRRKVFSALTDPEGLRRWAEPEGDVVAHVTVGGTWDLGGGGAAKITALDVDELLAVTMPRGGRNTDLSFRLEEKSGDRCGLYVRHGGFAAIDRDLLALRGRWSDRLVGLKNVVEAGEAGFTEAYTAQVRAT